ncbi:MAG: hypothetical protein ACYCXY_12095 [Acidimicrobiales bacterium]
MPEPIRAQVEAAGAALLVDQSAWGRPLSDAAGAPAVEETGAGRILTALSVAVGDGPFSTSLLAGVG